VRRLRLDRTVALKLQYRNLSFGTIRIDEFAHDPCNVKYLPSSSDQDHKLESHLSYQARFSEVRSAPSKQNRRCDVTFGTHVTARFLKRSFECLLSACPFIVAAPTGL
jgi:hypothetical protein